MNSDPIEKATAEIMALINQARADALREAAKTARERYNKAPLVDEETCYEVADSILALIDQPPCAECAANLSECSRGPEDKEDCLAEMASGEQEGVCECNADPSHRIGFKFCPYCGKTIKVTHGDKS